MSTIVTRSGKGSPLTNTEVDSNFTNLNTDKAELSGANFTGSIDVTGSVTADGLTVDTSNTGNGINYGFDIRNSASGSGTSYAMPAISWSNGGLRWASVHGERNSAGGYGGLLKFHTMNSSGNATERLKIDNNGDISFFEDTGSTPKFIWSAASESLGIGRSPLSLSSYTVLDLGAKTVGSMTRLFGASGMSHQIMNNNTDMIISADDNDQKANTKMRLRTDGTDRVVVDDTGIDVSGSVTAPIIKSTTHYEGISYRIYNGTLSNYGRLSSDSLGSVIMHTGAGEGARLTSTGLGIGTSSPARKLDVNGGAIVRGFLTLYGTGTNNALFLNNTSYEWAAYTNASNNFVIADWNAVQTRLTIDTSGRVGIGTVPSAWRTAYPDKVLDLGAHSALYDQFGGSTFLANNFYRSNDNSFKYKTTAGATAISLDAGQIGFLTAPSGTAGATATLTNHMLIDNQGRVGIGTSSPSTKMHLQTDDVGAGSGEVAIRMTVPANSISAQNEIRSGVTSGTNPYMSFAVRETSSPYATVEAMRIDNQGRVGIGCLPAELLHVHEASTGVARMRLSNTDGYLEIGTNNQVMNLDSQTHTFRNEAGSSEYMRIDSSGNLLVGTSNTTWNTAEGLRYFNGDALIVTRNADAPLFLNRLSNDGSIAEFTQAGTTVGSWKSRAGVVSTIVLDPRSGQGAGLTGAGAGSDTTRHITPTDESGVEVNGKVSLGNSTNSFRDAYLAGGVYLGGTGAANLLDDYEEGTCNLKWSDGTNHSSSVGNKYTKVGRLVTVSGYVAGNVSGLTGTAVAQIAGFPFAFSDYGSFTVKLRYIDSPTGCIGIVGDHANSGSVASLTFIVDNGNYAPVLVSDLSTTGNDTYFNITYTAT